MNKGLIRVVIATSLFFVMFFGPVSCAIGTKPKVSIKSGVKIKEKYLEDPCWQDFGDCRCSEHFHC